MCRRNANQALAALQAIAGRMDLTLNQDKTKITPLREGFNFIGFEFVKRRSPSSGKQRIYIFPSKRSQRNIRHKIRSFTRRRAPIKPDEFVRQINQAVLGWANYYRHTNASQAFRSLQRFINIRFRRYLNYRTLSPRLRVETISQSETVCHGNHLHWQRFHQVRESNCACSAMKTVGPPYSGKLNVRWDGKGMVKEPGKR